MIGRLVLCLFFLSFFLPLVYSCAHAADEKAKVVQPAVKESAKSADKGAGAGELNNTKPTFQDATVKTIALKLMIVNPSKKYKQIHKLKQLLPPEVEPRHVMEKGDLSIGFDANAKAYYVSEDIELDPGQSIVKEIKVEDVWFIPEDQLKALSEEANDLYERLAGSGYEERARFLFNNLEILLGQILELQSDESLTAEEHIQVFRSNKDKYREAELDLALMRRLVVTAAGDGGALGQKDGKSAGEGLFGAEMLKKKGKEGDDKGSKGAIPAWVAWRVIFAILIFLGISSLLFHFSWARQMRVMEKRKRELAKPKSAKKSAFEDILGKPIDDPDPVYTKKKYIEPPHQ